LIALASIPAGLLLGLLAVLFAERFEGEARPRRARAKPAPQDAFRGVTVLARVAAVAQAPDLVIDQPSSAPAQELRQLARRITAPRQGPVPKVVALTSLDRRDGQAGVAGGLARALAQLGLRVLFIDANRPAAEPGLTAVLAGTARLSQVLRKDPRSNVLILSAATNGEAARSIWSSPAAERLMAHLRQVSDIVVVNAAPIARGTALPVVAQLSDALIVVTSANGEPHPGLGAALEYVKSATALPTGLVLTR
jgi:Mrp family chromosome partitioning ATPase